MSNYTPENYAQKILRDDMYSGLLTGDHTRATTKTLLDPEYAFVYSQNLYSHLSRLMPAKPQGILDIGCGPGAISEAFHRLLDVPVWGIDMSPSAIAYAQKEFPGPDFIKGSADNLGSFDTNSIALVHAREFYPFSRTSDSGLQMRFLNAALPKLVSGGLFCVIQIRDPKADSGIHVNLQALQAHALEAGYKGFGEIVMAPQFFFRRYGRFSQLAPIRWAISVAGQFLEILKPGRVTYIYWFKS